MYLKSLVLKGFKSFADRSVLSLEPGVIAIVGPNGSGKSNISDAVLWVLGERSPKNLRGQAMEDVIFSGSAARKAVSFAEVELVLDNSDGTLPVEYDEVSIARRMYRSGESEYLINGNLVRRLDVVDILHDSGLGTGTHSIISQGSLDSILQSKPEDRRALIEEAAGVLKHKQRKDKSARKLEAMDHHLARVRDVTAEVSRQLGPLERKAKRAQSYKVAKSQLSELKLALAVDDLRKLQDEWERVCAEERTISSEVAERRETVEAAEQRVNEVQEVMRRESVDAGELARRQRRAAQIAERLDSCEILLRERRRSTLDYQTNVRMSLNSATARAKKAKDDLATALDQRAEAQERHEAAKASVEACLQAVAEADGRRSAVERELAENERALRACEQELATMQREKEGIQENLSNGLAHEKLVEARKHELSTNLDKMRAAHETALSALDESRALLSQLEESNSQAQSNLVACFEALEQARAERDEAQARVKVTETELKAIEQAQRASRRDNAALSWIADNASGLRGSIKPLVQMIKAPGSLEELVENLLSEDIAAVAIDSADDARSTSRALLDQALAGDVGFVMRHDDARRTIRSAQGSSVGTPLIDLLTYDDTAAGLVESLFGDVVVCNTSDDAFAAHAADAAGLRFVSRDGCAIWPTGKVRVFGKRSSDTESVLARERRCEELSEQLERHIAAKGEADEQCAHAEESYREAQGASLKANEALANQKGVCSAAQSAEEHAASQLNNAVRELADIDRQLEVAHQTVGELRPKMDAVNEAISEVQERSKSLAVLRDELSAKVEPLRGEAAQLTEKLTAAKLDEATLSERRTYEERLVMAREHDVQSVERSTAKSRRKLAEKTVAIDRAGQAIQVIELLAAELSRKTRVLDDALAASQDASDAVHADAAKARDDARQAHDEFDQVNERMTKIRVEKSRLEIQVDAAVKVVVYDCETPLDKVSDVPPLEDRQATEDEAFKVERRIKNMGAINPDAAEEYAALKERYDFLASQLEDMETARRSLKRIVRVIDERMKDDFARTFDEVNANFSEVFATLFPGGSASLELEDPDDIESSGIEIKAQPRGKKLTKMMLMSGGEKSLTALALLFAVYKTRTTPFYILDEVEAALDDTNLRRLVNYIDTLRATTQLIMITHQRRTMEMADVLFGVSMQADGVTKVISQKLERALDQAE